ncbi:hypothetical protein E1176_16365 [Fulvivirga sp. RKSG066]|nr:hypothetical protein [Fulvivirga aurantia]
MIEQVELPIFPLAILPILNERIPLHIFEPRYRQLLQDVESAQMQFGIYYSHGLNKDRMGAIVELEAVVKRYQTGESDIMVKCVDTFLLTKFYNKFSPKLYPGGIIAPLKAYEESSVSEEFRDQFRAFMALKDYQGKIDFDIHDVAVELNLDIGDRLRYLKLLDIHKREAFLSERLRYRKFILEQELKVRDNFFLN